MKYSEKTRFSPSFLDLFARSCSISCEYTLTLTVYVYRWVYVDVAFSVLERAISNIAHRELHRYTFCFFYFTFSNRLMMKGIILCSFIIRQTSGPMANIFLVFSSPFVVYVLRTLRKANAKPFATWLVERLSECVKEMSHSRSSSPFLRSFIAFNASFTNSVVFHCLSFMNMRGKLKCKSSLLSRSVSKWTNEWMSDWKKNERAASQWIQVLPASTVCVIRFHSFLLSWRKASRSQRKKVFEAETRTLLRRILTDVFRW